MIPVYVAAGSNVDPEKNLAHAAEQIVHAWPDAVFSQAYGNKAVGFDGPDFINLVLGFHTTLPIGTVIEKLRAIETRCGRPRFAPKWASRTMDLDVLLYGDRVEKTDDYTLPRPDLLKRPTCSDRWRKSRRAYVIRSRTGRSEICGRNSIATGTR